MSAALCTQPLGPSLIHFIRWLHVCETSAAPLVNERSYVLPRQQALREIEPVSGEPSQKTRRRSVS